MLRLDPNALCSCGSGVPFGSCHGRELGPASPDVVVDGRPFSLEEARAYANQCRAAGQLAEAQKALWSILRVRPDDEEARWAIGEIGNSVAQQAYNAANYTMAADVLQRAVTICPTNPVIVCNLGLALDALGRRTDAIVQYRRALAMAPNYARGHANLAVALHGEGQVEQAVVHLRRAASLEPGNVALHAALEGLLKESGQWSPARAEGVAEASAHNALGVEHEREGRLEEAAASYRRAVELDPELAEAHSNLGNVLLKLGRFEAAVASQRRALELAPETPEIYMNLAGAFRASGQLEDEEACLRHAISKFPNFAEAHNALGSLLYVRARLKEAGECFLEAVRKDPTLAAAHNGLGSILREYGNLTHAREAFRAALEIQPNSPVFHSNLGMLFHDFGEGRESIGHFRRALELAPGYADARSNLLLCLNYDPTVDEATLFAEHRAWDTAHGLPRKSEIRAHTNPRDPEKRLRIGYVSCDLARHPVGFMIESVMRDHDRSGFEVVCYSSRAHGDDLTERLKKSADGWRSIFEVPDARLADMIRDDGIDILVDLSGHTGQNRLPMFARKPAPVQASWLGYWATTGLSAMDYVLTDRYLVPKGDERWFVEKVVRLPSLRFCYAPPDYAPRPSPPPSSKGKQPTFGSFNNLSKVTSDVVELWSRILAAAPEAKLLLKWRTLADAGQRERLHKLFEKNGISPERVELREASAHAEMLAEYGDMDVALDPFPFSGGLTSLEALWMGVPVVTMPGTRLISRQTHGIVSLVGYPELSCSTPADYVKTAVGLLRDVGTLTKMRADLRSRMADSPLCDGATFTLAMESAFRHMWRSWCVLPH